MQEFFSTPDDQTGGIDPQREAQIFEQRLARKESFFMDVVTIDEVFDYYRVMDEQEKALQLLDYALAHYPFHADFFFRKACVVYEKKDYPGAFDLVTHALAIQPSETNYLLLKGRILHQLQRPDEADAVIAEALSHAEEPADVYYQLGQLAQQDEQYRLALENYTKALTENPSLEDTLYEIVFCYENLDEQAEGITFVERYLEAHPYSSAAWYNLGILYHKLGRFEQSIDAFDYAILIQEDFLSAYFGKANALMEIGKHGPAIRVLLTSLHHDKNDIAALLSLGECYEQIADYARSRFYYLRCTELYANLPDPWYGIASTFEAEQRYQQAIHYYKKAIELNAEYFDAWLGLADCEYFLGNDVSAYEALKTAIELFPNDLEMWQVWAERLNDDGNADGALSLLDEAIRHNPTAIELYYQYAGYALTSGRSREGFAYLENALLMDYSQHPLLYDYCPRAAEFRPVQALIEQYRPQ